LEIYILQNSIKNWINELAFEYTVTVRGVHLSAGPHVSDKKNRGRGCDGAAAAKLADGGFSSDTEGTGVLPTTMCTYLCPHLHLY